MCGYNYSESRDNNETLCPFHQLSVLRTFMFTRSRKTNDTKKLRCLDFGYEQMRFVAHV